MASVRADVQAVVTDLDSHAPRDTEEHTPVRRRSLLAEVTIGEWAVVAVVALVLLVLVVIEPAILEAPIENRNTVLFTLGGTALALLAAVIMLRFRVPPIVRITVLIVPFVAVNWWLLSPYFIDDVVEEEFETSIAAALEAVTDTGQPAVSPEPATVATSEPAVEEADSDAAPEASPEVAPAAAPATTPSTTPAPEMPVLRGVGSFVGLAGHTGTGDAGIFENPDGTTVLRLENFDIQNGPDLDVYIVPGADALAPTDDSIDLGDLKGNVGNQTYELPDGGLPSGEYTVLVWCAAFDVEFVGATLTIT